MEDKTIRRNLYRVLRKTGVQKKDININATFNEDLKFDTVDWKIFTYYLEGIFNISLPDQDLNNLMNVKETLHYLGRTA
jgi:acyl carrier protein